MNRLSVIALACAMGSLTLEYSAAPCRGASVTGDSISGFQSQPLKDPNAKNSFFAVSYQFSPVNVGSNVSVTYTENDKDGGTYTNTPKLAPKDVKKAITVGKLSHGGPVTIQNRPKPDDDNGILMQQITSTSGLFMGQAAALYSAGGKFFGLNVPKGIILTAAGYIAPGEKRQGEAAGEVDDPMMISYSQSYAPALNADFAFDATDQSGGVNIFATDSSMEPDLLSEIDDDGDTGSAIANDLWSLNITGNDATGEPMLSVDFELNSLALDEGEIVLAGPFGAGEGASPTIDGAIATAFDAYVDAQVIANLSYDPSDGEESLTDFSPFPDGTMFVPYGGSVEFADGAAAVIDETPLPAPLLGGIALITLLAAARKYVPLFRAE